MSIIDQYNAIVDEYRKDFHLFLPRWTSGKMMNWLCNSPSHEFLMLPRWEEGQEPYSYQSFNFVSALLIEREGDIARRVGSMLIPIKE